MNNGTRAMGGVMALAVGAGTALAWGGAGQDAEASVGAGVVAGPGAVLATESVPVYRKSIEIDGVNVFYREAGPADGDTIVLLHGFPTSSHMFRDLIPELAEGYRVIAPDYPGFGLSDAPAAEDFEYSFDHLASIVDELLERVGAEEYVLYVMDYGAPVGFRIAAAHPERVAGLIVQNGNAYEEGLEEFWNPIKTYWADPSAENGDALRGLFAIDATVWQYTNGTRNPEAISPDNWLVDQPLLDRPGNQEIQLELFLDYGTNPGLYPAWQEYFREYQPPMLITWGKNDFIFPASGAIPYLQDLPDAELHLLDTGHFALEEDGELIAGLIRRFVGTTVYGDE
ncbi:MAG: pimeloyl-ACP methyl ester carboxylesterase [Phycisphaerales bacterium]|jgi:pimeloyl-ACP methyl ester carboxylesterase